jgi:hypothetical protein
LQFNAVLHDNIGFGYKTQRISLYPDPLMPGANVSDRSDRYRLAPQMQAYDNVWTVVAPYVTFITKPDFRSEIFNTDANGFRLSHSQFGVVDSISWWQSEAKGIVLGSSFVFGVGATHDRHTLVSKLNSITGNSFLNLGIRSANSTQELMASIPFLAKSKYVIICSGINNLTTNLQSIGRNELFGPFFGEESYETFAQYDLAELENLIEASLEKINWQVLIKEWWSRLRRKISRSRSHPDIHQGGAYHETHLSQSVERALEKQVRDLLIIARSIPSGSQLIFVAQPFAEYSRSQPTAEEQKLFEITDKLQSSNWQILKMYLGKLWPQMVAGLEKVCNFEKITFLDLNKVELTGWCFVDRVHMTDNGYFQVAQRMAAEII